MASYSYNYASISFCPVCDTTYAMAVIDGQLKHVCRKCGNEEATRDIVVHRVDRGKKKALQKN
jgi:DNA-directed RNA polymerase subunit M/transcription elongation factor TFIIS